MASLESKKSRKKRVKKTKPVETPRNMNETESENGNEEWSRTSPGPDPLADNPYLNREKCLLCQRDRRESDVSDSEDEELKIGPHNYALSQMSLWVCGTCKEALEEEERNGMIPDPFDHEQTLLTNKSMREAQQLWYNASDLPQPPPPITRIPKVKATPDLEFSPPRDDDSEQQELDNKCSCSACCERRQIEEEQEQKKKELHQVWEEVKSAIPSVYSETKKWSEGSQKFNKQNLKSHIERLCESDPHNLFQRVETQARDHMATVKVKLLQKLGEGHDTPSKAKAFVSLLIEEYMNLCAAAKILSDIFSKLSEHLRQFCFTWELHDKHLFQSIIYVDPLVQSKLPMLITQLRLGAASKEPYNEDSYPSLLHKYLKFDDEMAVVSVVWRDCHTRLERFVSERDALEEKERMIKEDWIFFKKQRDDLKKQIGKYKDGLKNTDNLTSGDNSKPPENNGVETITTIPTTQHSDSCMEARFSEAMKNLLESPPKKFKCPQCNKQRCPCHECSISHLITCGLLTPELQDTLLPAGSDGHCSASNNPFTIRPTTRGLDLEVKPPSYSSSASESSSIDLSDDESENQTGVPIPQFKSSKKPFSSQGLDPDEDSDPPDSWDEKLQLNPNINLFEEFLKESQRDQEKKAVLAAQRAAKKSVQNSSEPCPCVNCQKPTNHKHHTSGDNSSNEIPVSIFPEPLNQNPLITSDPKPAAFHLYPHIHGHTKLSNVAAEIQNGTGLTSQSKNLLQPEFYKLHAGSFAGKSSPTTSPIPARHQTRRIAKPTKKVHKSDGDGAAEVSAPTAFPSAYITDGKTITSPLTTTQSNLASALYNMDMVGVGTKSSGPATMRATKPHPWQQIRQDIFPSCLEANPNIKSDHEHTEKCFENLRGPLSHSSTAKDLLSSMAPWSSLGLPDLGLSSATPLPVTNNHINSISQEPATIKSPVTSSSGVNTTECQNSSLNALIATATAKKEGLKKAVSSPTTVKAHNTLPPPPADDQLSNSTDDDESYSDSSTSATNSRDKDSNKYCDCCYCEFFGHGASTQNNANTQAVEMTRERLRQKLKQKQKATCSGALIAQTCTRNRDVPAGSCIGTNAHSTTHVTHTVKTVSSSTSQTDVHNQNELVLRIGTADVNELVKYITGEEVKENSKNLKIDKKERKRLKKAEQKARKLEQVKNSKTCQTYATSELPEQQSSDAESDTEKSTTLQQQKSITLSLNTASSNMKKLSDSTNHKPNVSNNPPARSLSQPSPRTSSSSDPGLNNKNNSAQPVKTEKQEKVNSKKKEVTKSTANGHVKILETPAQKQSVKTETVKPVKQQTVKKVTERRQSSESQSSNNNSSKSNTAVTNSPLNNKKTIKKPESVQKQPHPAIKFISNSRAQPVKQTNKQNGTAGQKQSRHGQANGPASLMSLDLGNDFETGFEDEPDDDFEKQLNDFKRQCFLNAEQAPKIKQKISVNLNPSALKKKQVPC